MSEVRNYENKGGKGEEPDAGKPETAEGGER